jgi:hypothetical protein
MLDDLRRNYIMNKQERPRDSRVFEGRTATIRSELVGLKVLPPLSH